MSGTTLAGPAIPAVGSSGHSPEYDPNRPTPNILQPGERVGGDPSADNSTYTKEEAYIPLSLAELRIQSLMTDLQNMKSDHVGRMEKLKQTYEQLLKERHSDAKAKIDEARKIILDQIAEIAKLTNEKKLRDQFMESRSKEYENQLKDSRAELEKARVGLDVSQKQLREKENLIKQREDELEKKTQQCNEIQAELQKVITERDKLMEQKAQLERRLAAADGRPIGAGGASSDSLLEAQSRVIDLEKQLAILTGEKKALADEVELLRKAGPAVPHEDSAEQRARYQAALDELAQANAAMIEAHKEQTAKLISDAHRDRDEALAKQRDFYDKMIEQMVRLGEEAEKAKERAKAASLNLSDLEDAKKAVKDAEDTRAAISNERRQLDAKLTHCIDRLEEVEAQIRRNNDTLNNEVDPKLNALEQQVNALRAEADEAKGDRERASRYTLQEAVDEFNKIGIPFDQVTPQIITTMMQACGHGEVTAAQKASMREKKEEYDKLKEYSDKNPDDEAARAQLAKLRAEFKSIKDQAQKSVSDARSAMYSLKLDPALIEDDEFRATMSRACEMWREVALRSTPKVTPPQELVEQLARFNLTPEMMTPQKLAEIKPFLALFPDFNTAIKEHKAQKERRDQLRAMVDGPLAEALERAREAMSVANATGEGVAEATAQLDEATAQMAQAQQEAEQLEQSVHKLVQQQKEMLERVQSEAARLGVMNEEMKFRGVKNGKELQAVVDAWEEWQSKLETMEPLQRHDTDLPTGPSAEMLAELEALRARQQQIKNELVKLEQEREVLQKEDDDYRGKQRVLDMEATNADRQWREAQKRLRAAQNAAAAAASGEAVEPIQPETEEEDLTGGVAIRLTADIAQANQQLIRLADELENLKMKLRAAWAERDKLIEELNLIRKKHAEELAKAKAEAAHWQDELNRKIEEYKVTAGTHYAKFGIAGVNQQTRYTEQLAKLAQESDPHQAYRELILELEKSRDEAAERASNLQRMLEQGGMNAAAAAAASGATLAAGQTAIDSAELDKLRRELTEVKSSKAELERTIESLRQQLKVMQDSTAGSQNEIQNKLMAMTQQASEEKARADRLQEEKAQLERAQAQLDAAKAEIESQAAQLNKRVQELEEALGQSQSKCAQQEQEIAQLQATLAELQAKLEELKRQHEAELAALKAEHEQKMEAQATEFNAQIASIGAERDQAKAVLDAEIKAKEAAMAESKERAETIASLNATLAEKEQIIHDLKQKYHDEMDRRKRFQQDYEGLKGSIRVYCRIRPFIRNELENPDENARVKCVAPGPNTWTCILKTTRPDVTGQIITVEEEKSFDHVFLSDFGERYDNGNQAEVFKECECFGDMAFDGLNTCIFAYGQSGSGKTWTMRGDPSNPTNWGLKPRFIHHMYKLRDVGKHAYKAKISCSMYEIYNDQIYDILDRYEKVMKWQTSKGNGTVRCFKCLEVGHSFVDCKKCAKCHEAGHNFSVCANKQKGQFYIDRFSLLDQAESKDEEKKGGNRDQSKQAKTLTAKIYGDKVKIEGLMTKEFDDPASMFDYVDKAEILRRVRATGLNDESSRSHLIFTIYVERESLKPKAGQPKFTNGKLSLCDLAGSERADRVQMGPYVTPEDKAAMMEESKAINKSLTALTTIFNILGNPENRKEKATAKLNYRDNTLTTVMRDSVGGAARTLMFVNCSPSLINYEETKSTLGYGGIVKNITNLIATVDTGADELREELAALKAKLAQYEGAGNSG